MSYTDTTLEQTQSRDQTRALFGQTMGLVAITSAVFALGAYLGRDMSYRWGWVWFIAAFATLFGIQFAVRSSEQLAIFFLFGFGLLMGLAVAPTK
jgi:modulator of FtsH protease